MFGAIKHAFRGWLDDDCPQMAAALAYYTVFSLPPLLVLILAITGIFVDPAQIEGQIQTQIRDLLGAGAADQIQTMIRNTSPTSGGGTFAMIASVAVLLLGATGAFAQLQKALNKAWQVAPDPEGGGVANMLMKRVLSLGMVLTIGFLLLVSLVLSAAASRFGATMADALPGPLSGPFLQGIQVAVSLVVVSVLFALIFKILPDARVQWKDVWVGAGATAVLFVAGQFLLNLYFSQSDPGAAFGAAGAFVLILVWIYYTALIVLFGAELAQAWSVEKGAGIRPDEDAVRVEREVRPVSETDRRRGPAPGRAD